MTDSQEFTTNLANTLVTTIYDPLAIDIDSKIEETEISLRNEIENTTQEKI